MRWTRRFLTMLACLGAVCLPGAASGFKPPCELYRDSVVEHIPGFSHDTDQIATVGCTLQRFSISPLEIGVRCNVSTSTGVTDLANDIHTAVDIIDRIPKIDAGELEAFFIGKAADRCGRAVRDGLLEFVDDLEGGFAPYKPILENYLNGQLDGVSVCEAVIDELWDETDANRYSGGKTCAAVRVDLTITDLGKAPRLTGLHAYPIMQTYATYPGCLREDLSVDVPGPVNPGWGSGPDGDKAPSAPEKCEGGTVPPPPPDPTPQPPRPTRTPKPTATPKPTPTPNRAPQILSWSPANGDIVADTQPVLSVTASDPNGDVLEYQFHLEGEGVSLDRGWARDAAWRIPRFKLDPGLEYAWTFQVRDAFGNATPVQTSRFRVRWMPVAAEMIVTPDGGGYWTVDTRGVVRANGNAVLYGSLPDIGVNVQNVIGMARTVDGGGYWLVAGDGGVFSFGNAVFHGSRGGQPLNAPVVAMAPTPDGGGYWLVAADGGVFSFGNARFHGSMGGQALNAPVVGMGTTPDGGGYWLVAKDGGIFSFGNADFYGSMGGRPLNAPVIDMAVDPSGRGYLLAAEDGGVFAFGAARFYGSLADLGLNGRITSIAVTPEGDGYWLLGCDGGVFAFGAARFFGSHPNYQCRGTNPAPTPTPTPPPPPQLPARFALRAASGHIVAAESGGGGLVTVNRTGVGPWETFTRVGGVAGRIALRTHTGHFLTAEGGGGLDHYAAVNATRTGVGEWESFEVRFLGGSSIALRTWSGHFVTAHQGGGVVLVTDRTAIGAWETFEVIPVS
jgi:hypothetical protein